MHETQLCVCSLIYELIFCRLSGQQEISRMMIYIPTEEAFKIILESEIIFGEFVEFWIEKLSFLSFTRCPCLLFGCLDVRQGKLPRLQTAQDNRAKSRGRVS